MSDIPAWVTDDRAPTPGLDEFREAYDLDDNIWWRIGCGHHQNLFEAACREIDGLREQVYGLTVWERPEEPDEWRCPNCGAVTRAQMSDPREEP